MFQLSFVCNYVLSTEKIESEMHLHLILKKWNMSSYYILHIYSAV